jgi:hypothetical protein
MFAYFRRKEAARLALVEAQERHNQITGSLVAALAANTAASQVMISTLAALHSEALAHTDFLHRHEKRQARADRTAGLPAVD